MSVYRTSAILTLLLVGTTIGLPRVGSAEDGTVATPPAKSEPAAQTEGCIDLLSAPPKGSGPGVKCNYYITQVPGQDYVKHNQDPMQLGSYKICGLTPGKTYYAVIKYVSPDGEEGQDSPEYTLVASGGPSATPTETDTPTPVATAVPVPEQKPAAKPKDAAGVPPVPSEAGTVPAADKGVEVPPTPKADAATPVPEQKPAAEPKDAVGIPPVLPDAGPAPVPARETEEPPAAQETAPPSAPEENSAQEKTEVTSATDQTTGVTKTASTGPKVPETAAAPTAQPTLVALSQTLTALLEAMKESDPETRMQALRELGTFAGPEAKAVVAALVELLRDWNEDVRLEAAAHMGTVTPGAKAAVPVLIEALKLPDRRVRRVALYALIKIGKGAKDAEPEIRRIAQYGDPLEQKLAWFALDKIVTRKPSPPKRLEKKAAPAQEKSVSSVSVKKPKAEAGTAKDLRARPNGYVDIALPPLADAAGKGFNIYYSAVSGKDYVKFNPAPLPEGPMTLTGLIAGKNYYYILRTVDKDGKEGNASPETKVTALQVGPEVINIKPVLGK